MALKYKNKDYNAELIKMRLQTFWLLKPYIEDEEATPQSVFGKWDFEDDNDE